MKIINPLTGNEESIVSVLRSLAGQDGCDGEPYDQMQIAAEYIEQLELKVKTLKSNIIVTKGGLLYKDGQLLDVISADQVAREHGYLFAERMVKALEEDPTAIYNPELFPEKLKED